ncbi:hypothetical protein Q9233_017464 [Columba guinea]|nr:hypothetical protein Q9233_017464 [Columba guinea]
MMMVDQAKEFATAVDIVVHPGFDALDGDNSYAHDLMLLRVEPPFSVTPLVQPLRLPEGPPATGDNCTVMGWGTTTSPQESYPDTPQCVNVTVGIVSWGDHPCGQAGRPGVYSQVYSYLPWILETIGDT